MATVGSEARTEETSSVEIPSFLATEQHHALAVTLLAFAILGTILSSMNIRMFLVNPEYRAKGGIFYFHMVITNMCMVMLGTPFTAVCHFVGTWVFGDIFCQMYAFCGMFFGIANIFMLAFISMDRSRVLCSPKDADDGAKYYPFLVAAGWFIGFLAASAPLSPFGWSRYTYEPSGTACAVDYMTNDSTYVKYITTVFVVCFLVPFGLMLYSYGKACVVIKRTGKVCDWADETNVCWQSCLCLLHLVFCWGLYGVTCLWTVFVDPSTLPLMLTVIAPVAAKVSPILTSWIYIMQIKRFRGAVADMFKPKKE
ncbi:visual pigment-like receptor peropsin [Glandiceps talaboti]